jgi:hypothetical protein
MLKFKSHESKQCTNKWFITVDSKPWLPPSVVRGKTVTVALGKDNIFSSHLTPKCFQLLFWGCNMDFMTFFWSSSLTVPNLDFYISQRDFLEM